MKFLTAKWQDLILISYSVDPNLLKPYVPAETSIDLFEGKAYISLVAFMFRDTRLMGIPIPWHVNFEEVNLRFYVKPDYDPSKRAVTFIREIVPRYMIATVANNLFDENYVACPMSHNVSGQLYQYGWNIGRPNSLCATVDQPLAIPGKGTVGEFITEHYWGYASGRRRTVEYEVQHPQWECCEVRNYSFDVDFEATYGSEFAFLKDREPEHVQFAAGSAVSVSFPRRLPPQV